MVANIKLFEKSSDLKALVSPVSWKIIQQISKEPSYPLKIAKSLNMHEQKVYYHINKLSKAGIIKVEKEEEIKGANAKFYGLTSKAYGLSVSQKQNIINSKVLDFFSEFNSEKFSGQIIVGSPEPHGPLKTWAKDSHYSSMLSFFLGNYFEFSPSDFIAIDSEVKMKSNYDNNFILIGGPGVNVITLEFNEFLPLKFQTEFVGEAPSANFGKGFISAKTGKEYNSSSIGIIEKIKNPHNPKKAVIVFAGVGKSGTFSAIYALVNSPESILKEYKAGEDFYKVIQGNDLDGDGKIDSFEVLE